MRNVPSGIVSLALCLQIAFTLQPGPAAAQSKMSAKDEAIYREMVKSAGMDPDQAAKAGKDAEASRRWTEGKGGIVHYHVVGAFQGKTNVVGGSNWIGYADVTDRVEIDLDWKLAESKLEGTPAIRNAKSEVRNLRNPEPKCLPPVLKGEYEHFELLGVRQGLGGALELQVQTAHPAVEVAQSCTGSRITVPASRKTRPEELVVPSPVLLETQLPDSDDLRISSDRKSLVHRKAGWTWTFTPSVRK
jgi:hypothetical protein